MDEFSIIINGVRYDAVEEKDTNFNSRCAFYSNEKHCVDCIIGMNACERLIGVDGVFKKSTKSFER
jgi:hypothetical protein